MPDEEVETPEVESPEDPQNDQPFDEERAKAKIAKANSEAANLRKRLKELEAKAAKLDELEDAKKTETERLTEQQRSLEERAAAAETDAARLRVALRKGLSEVQARRLIGTTEEELDADADELLATFAPSDDEPKATPATKPREQLRPGTNDPDAPVEETDVRKLGERMFSR